MVAVSVNWRTSDRLSGWCIYALSMRKMEVRMKEQELTLEEWKRNVLSPHTSRRGSLLRNQDQWLRVTGPLLIYYCTLYRSQRDFLVRE